MAIVQRIEYKSSNEYFAGFLANAVKESDIKGSVEFKDNLITLTLDDSDELALERFSAFTQKFLPHSIFIGKIDTTQEDIEVKENNFSSKAYNIAPCPICLDKILNPASEHYLDDSFYCTHYCNNETYIDEDNTTFSPHFYDNDCILLTNAKKARELFLITDEELKALFSIEKPTIKVTLKDEKLKELTGEKFFRVKSAYNIKSTLAAINAKDSEIDYLFFNQRDIEPEVIIVQENLHMVYDNRVSKELESLSEDKKINRFLNILKESGFENAIGAYISQRNGISFIVKNNVGIKRVIDFNEFNLQDTLKAMREDEIRKKLLNNFNAKFPEVFEKLKDDLNLYETIATILELKNPGYESLSNKAFEFHGNGGLKIDMFFKEGSFDYESMIGSIMSFKIAGVEPHYLAYSIFEAMGDMVISVLSQLKGEFKIDKFILMGDIFANSVVYSRILSKFQISTPYFSTDIALDYKV